MKCYKCGTEVKAEAKFCHICGSPQGFSRELIEEAKQGKQDAITELYNRTYNNVYQSVRMLVKDEDMALDIVQDAYIRGFQHLDQLDEPNHFRAWMKRIGINTAKNYLKKKQPLLFSEMEGADEDDSPELQFVDERQEHLPEVSMDRQETSRLINEILDDLSEEQRLVVTLYFYEEMNAREIGDELGVSEDTVRSRLRYAKKKIETKVLEIEKRDGIRLHSLAPIPFLLLLFRSQKAYAMGLPNKVVLQGVQSAAVKALTSAGKIAAGTAAEAATETVAGTVTETAAKTVAETATKTAAKTVTETATKTAAKTVTETATKTAAKTVAETAAQTTAKTAAETVVTKTVAAAAGKTAAGAATKAIATKVAVSVAAVSIAAGGTTYAVHQQNVAAREEAAQMEAEADPKESAEDSNQQVPEVVQEEQPKEEVLPAESETDETVSGIYNKDLARIMETYGTENLQVNIDIEKFVISEDETYFEFPAQIITSTKWDSNPLEGKSAGDVIDIPLSEVTGATAEYTVWEGDQAFLQDDGKWEIISEWTTATTAFGTEIYNGTLRIYNSDASPVYIYGSEEEYGRQVLTEIRARNLVSGMTGAYSKTGIREEYGTGDSIYLEGLGYKPGITEDIGGYIVSLDENGYIISITQQWNP